jgi:serine/threonine protein kinase
MLKLNHPNVLKLLHWQIDYHIRYTTAEHLAHLHLLLFHAYFDRYLILEHCIGPLQIFVDGNYKDQMLDDLEALTQMAAGLQHIHSKHLVHGDIKTRKILISKAAGSENILLKIAGFQTCTQTSEDGTYTHSGVKKTPNMAPELLQILGNSDFEVMTKASNVTDVFSLGCVFYQFLTSGTHPFGDYSSAESNIIRNKFNLSSKTFCPLSTRYPIDIHSMTTPYPRVSNQTRPGL